MKVKRNIAFKDCSQDQQLLLPPNIADLIAPNHPVCVVSRLIDNVDLSTILQTYSGGGTSSYHPRMLLKVLVFAYLSNIYSSRKIEAALKENILFMIRQTRIMAQKRTMNLQKKMALKLLSNIASSISHKLQNLKMTFHKRRTCITTRNKIAIIVQWDNR